MSRPQKTHFQGCLIGQCLGDALGFLREGWGREECEQYVMGPLQQWLNGCAEEPFPGQYTDDSQLARELLQSYAEHGGFAPAAYARRIAAIFSEDRIVGRGAATHQAAMRLAAGAAWDQAGTASPSAGNGSAMRAGPIGLLFDQPESMLHAARTQGWITHQDPRASAGAVAIASAVHLASRTDVVDPQAMIAQLAAWTADIDVSFSQSLQSLTDWLDSPWEDVLDHVAPLGLPPGAVESWDRISPFVVPSVIWSLYAFLHHPNSYGDAIVLAIRVGGDVDTTAAMTGAISGAHLGLDGLPTHLAASVHDRGAWTYERLLQLADTCHRQAMDAA